MRASARPPAFQRWLQWSVVSSHRILPKSSDRHLFSFSCLFITSSASLPLATFIKSIPHVSPFKPVGHPPSRRIVEPVMTGLCAQSNNVGESSWALPLLRKYRGVLCLYLAELGFTLEPICRWFVFVCMCHREMSPNSPGPVCFSQPNTVGGRVQTKPKLSVLMCSVNASHFKTLLQTFVLLSDCSKPMMHGVEIMDNFSFRIKVVSWNLQSWRSLWKRQYEHHCLPQ